MSTEVLISPSLDNEDETPQVGRAVRVAQALASKNGDDFAKPGNLIEVRFVKGQSLSLTSSRLLALMILTAGGEAWRPVPHRMRKADIRRGHKGNERISDMLEELHRTLFAVDDLSWRGRKATKRFSLIQSSREEAEEDGGESGWIEWEFTPDARRLIQESETYAVLNRQAVLGFRSAYALKLYELGALRIYRRQPTWRCDMTTLRAALGISPEVYTDFAQLRRKVLEKAKAEIDQLAHFTVSWTEIRRGRAVAELEFTFEAKLAPEAIKRLATPAKTVKTVKAGSAKAPSPPLSSGKSSSDVSEAAASSPKSQPQVHLKSPAGFPSGPIRYHETFADVARKSGGGWDIDLIAAAYRESMGERLAGLSGIKLERSWKGFCEAFAARRGRP